MQAGLAWLAEIPRRTITQREVVSFFGFFQMAQAGNWLEAHGTQLAARKTAATARAGRADLVGVQGGPAGEGIL